MAKRKEIQLLLFPTEAGEHAPLYRFRDGEYSLRQISEMTGLRNELLRIRINDRGLSADKAVALGRLGERGKKYSYKGRSLTLKEWEKRTGVASRLMWERINIQGWSFREAISIDAALVGKGPRTYEHNGQSLTLSAWAEKVGIKTSTLKKRLHELNWPFEKAISNTIFTAGRKPITYHHNGESLTIKEWAHKTGVDESKIRYRIKRLGWDMRKALCKE